MSRWGRAGVAPFEACARRVIGALIAVIVVGGLAGAAALRAVKKNADNADFKVATTLEFGAGELATVEQKSLPRWLPVSGTMQPLNQATVKAKVSGDGEKPTGKFGRGLIAIRRFVGLKEDILIFVDCDHGALLG